MYASGLIIFAGLIFSLSLMALIRFSLPNSFSDTTGDFLYSIPFIAYFISALLILLIAQDWEFEGKAYRLYLLCGINLEYVFIGKSIAASIILCILYGFVGMWWFLFFSVSLDTVRHFLNLLFIGLPLSVGLAICGQMVSALAQHSAYRYFLSVALFVPLGLPLVIAASGQVQALALGLETMKHYGLMVAAILVYFASGWMVYGYLFEE